ncbi:MAG: thermopsin family protease, partial [Thermoplasmata archaeon]
VTVEGQQGFGPDHQAPAGCVGYSGPVAHYCPNEYWLQNVINYAPGTHTLSFDENIWNFSNPTAVMSTNALSGRGTPSTTFYGESGPSITVSYPFTLALYLNTTTGPCHVGGVGVVGAANCHGQTGIDTEVFMNYTVWNGAGAKVCPATNPTDTVCGEYDDVFFNAGTCQNPSNVSCSTPGAVPVHGPNGRIGSATIQANGSAYDPLGLTNDYELDYGIGSSSGATTGVVYANATLGIDYCTNTNVSTAPGSFGQCQAYTSPPSAYDYGGETGETNSGMNGYWTPETTSSGPSPLFLHIHPGGPVAHIVTGPSLLEGLWNASGCNPYPCDDGSSALSFAHISPANAWIGLARGAGVTNQSEFQVAPTFGFWSPWAGSGGTVNPTQLGYDLLLEPGMYTIEVELSGYDPIIETLNLTASSLAAPYPTDSPIIALVSDPSTGVYTLDWAFGGSDLQNLTATPGTSCGASIGSPCDLVGGAPTVGAPFGVTGSVSWLFSNLNDYMFIQWIGVFINQTTAYAGFTTAPSMKMVYPEWQYAQLSGGTSALVGAGAPTTNYFQYYLFHTQNFFIEGGTHLGATWIYSEESGQVYSMICNVCGNVLIASNTFAVSDEGLDFLNAGTSAASLPYKAPLVNPNGFINQGAPQLQNTRNVVWGNTFVAGPTPGFSGIYSPTRFIATTDSWNRIYNNQFNALATNNPTNLSLSDTGTALSWWNATCVSGYKPLSQETYPGTGPTGVCEPLSYSQSLDGIAMTGAINGASYQGGNAWSAYGNEPNPYANIPFVARTTTETGTAGISAANVTRAGDYAPLITISVSELSVHETGLPSSATATAFEARITNSTGYGWFNETATTVSTTLNFYVPFGTYGYAGATTLAGEGANPATGSVVFNTPSQIVTVAFATAYLVTFTESGLPAATRWYVNISGQASLTSTTTTATISLPNGTYSFTAATVNKLYAPSYTPSFTVSGAPVGVPVTFALFTYSATFTETGLPGGNWNVTA